MSEALYLRDPDGNGVELYWDRPREEWPRDAKRRARDVHAPARPRRSAARRTHGGRVQLDWLRAARRRLLSRAASRSLPALASVPGRRARARKRSEARRDARDTARLHAKPRFARSRIRSAPGWSETWGVPDLREAGAPRAQSPHALVARRVLCARASDPHRGHAARSAAPSAARGALPRSGARRRRGPPRRPRAVARARVEGADAARRPRAARARPGRGARRGVAASGAQALGVAAPMSALSRRASRRTAGPAVALRPCQEAGGDGKLAVTRVAARASRARPVDTVESPCHYRRQVAR